MKLCENKQTFYALIETVAVEYGIAAAVVEKDYYVTLLLAELKERLPYLIFKGGTSLSKCHKIIDRFSEDIDLTLDEEHFTVGNKRKVKSAILDARVALGFKVTNEEDIRSRRDYNIYEIEYPRHYFSAGIKPTINAETVYIQKSYPHEVKPATSLVYDYVSEQGNEQFVLTYTELKPFDVAVQTIERTLVDKVFAVCDYKIDGRIYRNSRHIHGNFSLGARAFTSKSLL